MFWCHRDKNRGHFRPGHFGWTSFLALHDRPLESGVQGNQVYNLTHLISLCPPFSFPTAVKDSQTHFWRCRP